jgi:hypothetical protein
VSRNQPAEGTLARIRILIAGMPQLIADVIRGTLAEQPDMQLVDDNCAVDDLLSGQKAAPDVLIVGLDGAAIPAFCAPLLYGTPHMKVLAVSNHGLDTALYELRPHRVALGNVTPNGLVHAIRGSFRRHNEPYADSAQA